MKINSIHAASLWLDVIWSMYHADMFTAKAIINDLPRLLLEILLRNPRPGSTTGIRACAQSRQFHDQQRHTIESTER
jgi:hypothetical protein